MGVIYHLLLLTTIAPVVVPLCENPTQKEALEVMYTCGNIRKTCDYPTPDFDYEGCLGENNYPDICRDNQQLCDHWCTYGICDGDTSATCEYSGAFKCDCKGMKINWFIAVG